MKPIRLVGARFREPVAARFGRDVPIVELRHNDLPVYLSEGYGGKPIHWFPPHRFFALYHAGAQEEAVRRFQEWYAEQFARYARVSSRKGGMHKGSLFRLALSLHRDRGIPVDPGDPIWDDQTLHDAIRLRVEQRFGLLEAIRAHGYSPDGSSRIVGISRGREVFLTGGHHRAAALSVLGQTILPEVITLPALLFRLFQKVGAL